MAAPCVLVVVTLHAVLAVALTCTAASSELQMSLSHPAPFAQVATPYAVVVYGATPAGISAAIAASRALRANTARVLLVEPSMWIGGMASGGLGCTDKVGSKSYGGLAREFVNRTNARYTPADGERRQLPHCTTYTSFEPHVATEVFHEMLSEAGVHVLVGATLANVVRNGSKLVSIQLALDDKETDGPGNVTASGSVFIDSTYEGDLLAMSGVEFTFGRESRAQYNESLAGRRPLVPGVCYGFRAAVNPFANSLAASGSATSQRQYSQQHRQQQQQQQQQQQHVLPMVWSGDIVAESGADRKVMSYNYRLCLTNATTAAGGKRIELTKPAHYDPAQFELLRRYLKDPDFSTPRSLSPSVLKIYTIAFVGDGVKADVNSASFPISTNLVGGSWGYPNGTATERAAIISRHKSYTKSLLWFWKTDPAVPSHLRAEMAQWAWCGDEFVHNEHFPTQLYVREGRRMVGEQVVTQNDATDPAQARSAGIASIAVADYAFDVHPVEIVPSTSSGGVATGTKNARAIVEGCLIEKGARPVAGGFQIPYAAILPKAAEATNLLVPVALSTSHVAFAAIRLELTWIVLGQSSGVAAALAVTQDLAVQQVPLPVLHRHLLAAGQVLDP